MSKNKSGGGGKSASERSWLLNLMYRGLGKIKKLCKESSILRFFSDYDRVEEYSEKSFLVKSYRSVKSKIRRKFIRMPRRELGTEQISPNEVGIYAPATLPRSFKTRIGAAVEESRVLRRACALLQGLLYVPMMSYGVFLFSFGLFTTVTQAMLYFLLGSNDGAALDLFVGLALVLLSLPIMFKGYEPMIDHFRESVIGNLLFRMLRTSPTAEKGMKASKPTFLFFLIGMAVGLLTYFTQPLILLLLIFLSVAALCVWFVPETGVCLLMFALPFFSGIPHASLVCAGAILYTGFCMLLKVIVGKRSMSFGLMDGIVLLFGLTVLSTGFVGGQPSSHSALLYAAMISGYFTLSNLLRSSSWIKRSFTALSLSSMIVSLTGILDHFLPFDIRLSVLSDPMVATVYLLAVTVPVLAMVTQADRASGRFLYALILVANITYLVLLGSPVGMFALFVELLVFFLFYSKGIWTVLLLALLSLPFLSYVIHPDFGRLADQLFASDRIELWRALGGIFVGAPLTGIGMSDGILLNALSPEITANLADSNTWLRLLTQVGIPGFALFLIFVLLWYMKGFTLLRKQNVKTRSICLYLSLMSALTGLLIAGSVSYLWCDNRLLLLFWMMAGIACALHRSAKQKVESDERVSAYMRSDGIQYVDVEMVFTVPSQDRVAAVSETSGKDE